MRIAPLHLTLCAILTVALASPTPAQRIKPATGRGAVRTALPAHPVAGVMQARSAHRFAPERRHRGPFRTRDAFHHRVRAPMIVYLVDPASNRGRSEPVERPEPWYAQEDAASALAGAPPRPPASIDEPAESEGSPSVKLPWQPGGIFVGELPPRARGVRIVPAGNPSLPVRAEPASSVVERGPAVDAADGTMGEAAATRLESAPAGPEPGLKAQTPHNTPVCSNEDPAVAHAEASRGSSATAETEHCPGVGADAVSLGRRALEWLRRQIQVDDEARRASRAPVGYYLRSPLLSGFFMHDPRGNACPPRPRAQDGPCDGGASAQADETEHRQTASLEQRFARTAYRIFITLRRELKGAADVHLVHGAASSDSAGHVSAAPVCTA